MELADVTKITKKLLVVREFTYINLLYGQQHSQNTYPACGLGVGSGWPVFFPTWDITHPTTAQITRTT